MTHNHFIKLLKTQNVESIMKQKMFTLFLHIILNIIKEYDTINSELRTRYFVHTIPSPTKG